ncbi:MAG: hypothetical protein WBX27_02540 [Specibacter sp.]
MFKMIVQATALALGLVTVVLGVVALTGRTELVPFVIGAAVITVALLVVLFVDKKKSAKTQK